MLKCIFRRENGCCGMPKHVLCVILKHTFLQTLNHISTLVFTLRHYFSHCDINFHIATLIFSSQQEFSQCHTIFTLQLTCMRQGESKHVCSQFGTGIYVSPVSCRSQFGTGIYVSPVSCRTRMHKEFPFIYSPVFSWIANTAACRRMPGRTCLTALV